VPRIPQGGRVPMHGYAVSYADFRRSIDSPDYRKAVEPLLVKWFACSILVEGSDVWVKNDGGETIDALWLHLVIQADAEKQHVLYDTLMTLWR
jgi:hypothetical protein